MHETTAYREKEAIRTVAVIGSGVIGGGWVAAFLGHGCAVHLYDPAPGSENATLDHVAKSWPQMVHLGLAQPDDDWRSRFRYCKSLEEAVQGADFVQESTPERVAIKKKLFQEFDCIAPTDVIIASSTSSLPITDLQAGLPTAARFVLGHPFNPVHLIPLVEVGAGDHTDPVAADLAQAFYASMGKKPIRLQKEIYGHIANRLTSAMFREAVRLVNEGYACVADVDDAIRYGPALKWAIQGQFTTFHTSGGAGGLADFLPKFAPGIIHRWQTMNDPDLADPMVQEKLVAQMEAAAGNQSLDDIVQRQDETLMKLLSILK